MYTCTRIHTHVHINMPTDTCTHTHAYIHMYAYTCIQTHVHIHTHARRRSSALKKFDVATHQFVLKMMV